MAESNREKEKFDTGRLLEGVSADDSYSLEDILNEFGGWSARQTPAEQETPPAAPEPAAEQPPAPAEPEPLEEEVAPIEAEPSENDQSDAQKPASAARFQFINLDLSAPRTLPEDRAPQQDELWTWSAEAAPAPEEQTDHVRSAQPVTPRRTEQTQRPPRQPEPKPVRETKRRRKEQEQPHSEPKRAPTPPAVALRRFRNRSAILRLRAILLLLLSIAALLLTLAPLLHVAPFTSLSASRAVPVVLLILMCVSAAASVDQLARGVVQLISLRFGLELLLTASFVVCVIDAAGAIPSGRVPYCAVVCLGFLFAGWSNFLTCVGSIRSLRIAANEGEHCSVKVGRAAWNDLDCVYKATDRVDDFVEQLEAPNRAESAMRLYVPMALAASFVFSIVCHFRADTALIQMLSACLGAALPVCGFICYARPFAHIAARLSRAGAALCGWRAAKILSGDLGVLVTDTDLYPPGTVSISGVKVYHDYRLEQMLGYAATAIARTDSHLKPLFLQLTEENGVRLSEIGSFRTYEGGGIGAEIRGDIVLVGSLGFMHLMGVRLPQGTNIRQAVYVAINGLIAGVIAISYNASGPVASALQTTVRRRGLNLIGATRDFLISPAMLHAVFRIPTTRSEFPPVSDRFRLSSLTADDSDACAAILSHGSLLPFCEAIVGARSLISAVTGGTAVNVFGGLFGLLVVFFLGMGGALETASAVNLLLFVLIWMIPSLLITMWANKF